MWRVDFSLVFFFQLFVFLLGGSPPVTGVWMVSNQTSLMNCLTLLCGELKSFYLWGSHRQRRPPFFRPLFSVFESVHLDKKKCFFFYSWSFSSFCVVCTLSRPSENEKDLPLFLPTRSFQKKSKKPGHLRRCSMLFGL